MDAILFSLVQTLVFGFVPLYIFLASIIWNIFTAWLIVDGAFQCLKYLGYNYQKRKKRVILWFTMGALVLIQIFFYVQYSFSLRWVT